MDDNVHHHDLYEFLRRCNKEILDEYKRISERVKEDPGTAGDQGEENWRLLIEKWIPPYFKVVTKGRIIDHLGNTTPQIDVLVLSPDYPTGMISCKEYLAGGVVAAFECKLTLKREHLEKFMKTSKIIKKMSLNRGGTPRRDLVGGIYYGMLAHSHVWTSESDKVIPYISSLIEKFDKNHITHPIEMPDYVCVADLGMWKTTKGVVPDINDNRTISVISSYIESDPMDDCYTPVGAFIFDLLKYIAWEYPSVRGLVSYLQALRVDIHGKGTQRRWNVMTLSEETRLDIIKLKNGSKWDEWNMAVQ